MMGGYMNWKAADKEYRDTHDESDHPCESKCSRCGEWERDEMMHTDGNPANYLALKWCPECWGKLEREAAQDEIEVPGVGEMMAEALRRKR